MLAGMTANCAAAKLASELESYCRFVLHEHGSWIQHEQRVDGLRDAIGEARAPPASRPPNRPPALVFECALKPEARARAARREQGANVSEHPSASARLSSPAPTNAHTPLVVPLEPNEPADAPDILAGVLSDAHSDERNALAVLAVSYLCGI